MNLVEIFTLFPDQESCIAHLEQGRWPEGPVCPYCLKSDRIAKVKDSHRYHCNSCNTGFSVTVNTIFHDTKLPLQKWFLAILLMFNAKKGLSAKQLERDLKVTYKTAWYMAMRIRRALIDNQSMLQSILEVDETCVGGKPRKNNDGAMSGPGSNGAKRGPGIAGQYHWVSEKFLPLYLAEFCFRYNERSNVNIFALALKN